MKRIALLVAIAALACGRRPAVDETAYKKEIEAWRAQRIARLRSENGWLSLVGLQWLHEGRNAIEKPAGAGAVVLANGIVTLEPNPSLTIDGKPVAQPVQLIDDTRPKGPTVVHSGSTVFNAIRRADKFGLRVKDPNSPARVHFRGIDAYPVDSKWRIEAHFEPFNPPRHVQITNILGMTTDEIAPGLLAFTWEGKEYRVEPILEEGEKDYFIVFKDATSGKETYGAARFVYAPPPDKDGRTVIDFNKAYNPPCAFTPYATCPLPPPQNRLPFRVEAGEKKYAGAEH